MRYLFIVNCFIFSIYSFAQDPFKVPKEEIGKKGLYTIEQPGIPKHKDYDEIYRHNFGKKLDLDPSKKFYLIKHHEVKFKIYAPETYNPQKPPGILYLGYEENPSLSLDEIFEYCKPHLKQRNLIAVAPVRKRDNKELEKANLDRGHEYPLLVRRSVDLISERYKIDPERIITYSGMLISLYSKIAFVCCPKTFKYNILEGLDDLYYDDMPSPDNRKKYPSFGSQGQEITTTKDAAKNKYLFTYITYTDMKEDMMKDHNLKMKKFLEEFLKKNKFANSEIMAINMKGKEVRKGFPEIFQCVDKIDPKPFNAKSFLIQAQAFEKKKNLPKAFENYKAAAKYGFEEAVKKYNDMNKELQNEAASMMKSHLDKNYPEAYVAAQTILKKFGSGSSPQALNIYKTYPKDKKIVLEIKAAAFLAKAEAALKQTPPPKDKIKAACEKVIKTVPGTKTAEKAKKVIESLN